jgi:outer membrane protein
MLIKKLFPFLFLSFIYADSLNEVVDTALKNNYKLKSYQYTIHSKEYAVQQAKDGYFPSLSVYSSFTKEKYKEKYPTRTYKINDKITRYGVNIKQTLFDAKIFANIKDTKLRKNITISQKDSFLLNLYQNVLITYFEVIVNKRNLKFYTIKKDNYEKILENISEKAKYHYTTKTDVSQAKSNYSIAINDYIKAKSKYQNSLRQLKLLLLTNKDINIDGEINNNIHNILKSFLLSYDEYKAKLNNNPSIKIAALNMKVAKNEINNRKYNKYPTIDVSAGYSTENTSDSVPTKDDYKISINLNMNLYNKKINDAVLEAKELYLAALNDYEYQKNSLEMDFNKNWVNLQNTLEIVKSDTEKITETKEYLARAKESYKYKLITLSDYYKAENDYFEALINSQNDKLNLVYYYITLLAQTNELKKEVKRLKLLLN